MLRRSIQLFAIAVMAIVNTAFAVADYTIEPQAQVLEQAARLELTGTLKQKDNGYLYLEVSNQFIEQILPLITAPGKLVPPKHYTSKKGIGAHISVMYENERIAKDIWQIAEIGQQYSFQLLELRTVKITRDNKMKKLWLLAVDCPALERLRESYGLPPFIKDHNFHITLCTQMPEPAQVAPAPQEADAA